MATSHKYNVLELSVFELGSTCIQGYLYMYMYMYVWYRATFPGGGGGGGTNLNGG